MHKDIPALNEWMDMVESELDEREALPIARRDLESERAFLKVSCFYLSFSFECLVCAVLFGHGRILNYTTPVGQT